MGLTRSTPLVYFELAAFSQYQVRKMHDFRSRRAHQQPPRQVSHGHFATVSSNFTDRPRHGGHTIVPSMLLAQDLAGQSFV